LRKLNRTPEEKVALHEYLSRYPTGGMARRATIHLNALGDYSYRNHHLGARTVTTEKIRFQPLSAELSPASEESLRVIGSVIQNMPDVTLQIVFFQKNNRSLAQKRALAIKYFIQSEFPGIGSGRIGVSWFGEPQVISIKKKKRRIEESASFFTSVKQ
jgi:outer membrane protein OmpA-like peptidoglycan-associated protein